MKREAICSKMGERRAGAVVIAQLPTLLGGGNLGDKVDQVVRIDLALLLVQEAVDLAARCCVQEDREKHKDVRPPIHSCSRALAALYQHFRLGINFLSLSSQIFVTEFCPKNTCSLSYVQQNN